MQNNIPTVYISEIYCCILKSTNLSTILQFCTKNMKITNLRTVFPQPLGQKSFYNLQNSFFPTKFPCHPNGGKSQENSGKFEANIS